MEQVTLNVMDNRPIARSVWQMTLMGPCGAVKAPGQFVDIKLEGFMLRRPFAVCDWNTMGMTIIYKVVGKGTDRMTELFPGCQLDCLIGLGNGFDTAPSGEAPLLIGGGVGTPPIYALAKKLVSEGKKPQVILGFRNIQDVFYENEFRELGCEVTVTTSDGSYGVRGHVNDVFPEYYTYYYVCGSMALMKTVHGTAKTEGQLSLEERMGCGFGACMGCSVKTKSGYKRVCKDGPVLTSSEVIFD